MSRASMSTGPISFVTEEGKSAPLPSKPRDGGVGDGSRQDGPMHIALLGNFSGRLSGRDGQGKPVPLARRTPILIDRDNFEEVFEKLAVSLQLPVCDGPIHFGEFDDLHPDYIYQRVPLFDDLRALKRRLNKPDHFAKAVEEIQAWCTFRAENQGEHDASETDASVMESAESMAAPAHDGGVAMPADMLEAVLSQSHSSGAIESRYADSPVGSIDQLIKDIVSPFVEAKSDPRLPEYQSAVDDATAEALRKIMHSDAFQQLEASWRSVYMLVRRVETNTKLKFYLFDVSLEDIEQDLADCEGDLSNSGLYQRLVSQQEVAGGVPFSVINADYEIRDQASSVHVAALIAAIAEAAGGVASIGADPAIAGCADISASVAPEEWQHPLNDNFLSPWSELRSWSAASTLMAAAPRFMLRLPYGKKTSPIDAFDYEELPEQGAHPYYLWGNSAYLVTLVLAQSYAAYGWNIPSDALAQIDELPLHAYRVDGESEIKPCAEALLTDTGAERLASAGILPVRSVLNQAAVQLARLRSIAASGNSVSLNV